MRSFVDCKVSKEELLNSLQKHAQGYRIKKEWGYFLEGKGCAVGCTIADFCGFEIYKNDFDMRSCIPDIHEQYETLFGIPRYLARLEDCLFENMPKNRSLTFPIEFIDSINVGSDLSGVGKKFLSYIYGEYCSDGFLDSEEGMIRYYLRNINNKENPDQLWEKTVNGFLSIVKNCEGESQC